MSILVSNNAGTKLGAGIDDSQTAIAVQTGGGSLFPSPSSGSYFYATISEGTIIEIVKVTARTGDNFTVQRGQDSTTGHSFTIAAKFEQRWNRAQVEDFISDKIRSGVVDLGNGVSTVSVNFATARANANYALKINFECSDANPIFINHMITAKTASGFSVLLNAPTDSANYKMHYSLGDI